MTVIVHAAGLSKPPVQGGLPRCLRRLAVTECVNLSSRGMKKSISEQPQPRNDTWVFEFSDSLWGGNDCGFC